MEQLAELNHSLLSKLPLGFQSILKSLPLSDFSFLILVAVIISSLLYLLLSYGSTPSVVNSEGFGDYKREKKEIQVKINNPNPKKKVRRSKKIKVTNVTQEVKEERKVEIPEDSLNEEGWETVQAKKSKRKDE